MSKGESVGKGSVGSGSNNQEAVIEANGTQGSKGMTKSSGMSDVYTDSFSLANNNNGV